MRLQFSRTLGAGVSGTYGNNNVLGASSLNDGHSISGTASLQRQFGERLALQLGYTRLHQSYSNVAVLAGNAQYQSRVCFSLLPVLQEHWEDNRMADNLEEKASGEFDLEHYLGLVRRRHLHFLLPLFLGWLAVWGASWVLPAALPFRHPDSGGTADHAQRLRHSQCK